MSISIFRNSRFRLAFSLEPSSSLKTSDNCSKGSWKKFPKRVCFKVGLTSLNTTNQTFNIKTTLWWPCGKVKVYISCRGHRNTNQTLNEVAVVLFIRKRTNAIRLKFQKKWRKLHRSKIKTIKMKKITSNLTCLFLDLIFALSRAISRHNARVWDKLQCCSACNKMA